MSTSLSAPVVKNGNIKPVIYREVSDILWKAGIRENAFVNVHADCHRSEDMHGTDVMSDCVSPVLIYQHTTDKSSSGDEIPERDVTYIVLYDYLFTTLPHICTSGPKYFSK